MNKDNFDPTKPFGIGNGITEFRANEQPAPKQRKAAAQAEEPGADDPVADVTATEAIDKIGRMRSKEQLQTIVDTDQRATVKAAAEKRLGELG